jgi:hypothetical protein
MQDPEFLANAVFDRLVYGFNGYGMPDNGTPETIAAITRQDLVAFHEQYFVPNNAILAIVGDVTAEQAFAAAKKIFGGWERHDVPPQKLTEPPGSARRVVVIDKPDAVQTEVRVGHIGIPRNHPDYMPLNIAVRILGGEGSNRLHQVLRTERSLTYGAQADMDTLKYSGDIEAETNTRSEATGEVLRLIVDEFWRLQRERVGESELANAKAYMTGSFPLTIETPDQIAVQVLNAVFYGLPLEQLQNYRERVNAVTADDIERVARFYLKPNAVSVVLVGNASAFSQQLRGVGFGSFETVPLTSLDLLAPDFKKATARRADSRGGRGQTARAATVTVVPAAFRQQAPLPSITTDEGEKARALLTKVIAAKGGLEALRRIKTVKVVTAETMKAAAGERTATVTTYLEYPNHVRVESALPDGSQVQIFDGEHGWVRDPAGVHDVPQIGLRNILDALKREVVAALLAADRGELRVRLLPDVKDSEGRLQHALEMSSPSLNPFLLYVDPETNLISKQVFVASGPGQPIIEESFTEYRPVDGVRVAFVDTVRAGDQTLTRRITEIHFNGTLDTGLFKRPAS